MVLLRRTSALLAVVTLSGLVESFLTLLGTRTSQTRFMRTLFSNSSVRGKDQSWVTADPPCMRWMASVQASNLSPVSVSIRAVREGRAMSHSMYTAGRTTYLKIVVVALLCAIVFTVMGLTARVGEMNGARKPSRIEASGPVIRARAFAPPSTAQNAD